MREMRIPFVLAIISMLCSSTSVTAFDRRRFESLTSGNVKGLDDIAELFPSTQQEIWCRTEHAQSIASEGLKALLVVPKEERSFENTAAAYDRIQQQFNVALSSLRIVEMVCTGNALREEASKAVREMEAFNVDTFVRREIYSAFSELADNEEECRDLSHEQKFYLDHMFSGFEREGFLLDDGAFECVKQLRKELADLQISFHATIASDESHFTAYEDELDGTSKGFRDGLDRTADGAYIIRCDYPTVDEVLGHCTVESTRMQMHRAFNNRAYPDNVELLHMVIAKRDVLAHELGFESFAHRDLSDNMAGEPATVQAFLSDLLRYL